MRQGGRLVPWLLLALLPASGGEARETDYLRDLLGEAPFRIDRDANGIPDAWSEIREPGFRAFPGSIAIEDGTSLRFALNGRTVGLEIQDALSIQPDAAYRLEGKVRSRRLVSGIPEVEVRWLDRDRRLLPSVPLALPVSEAWTPFRIEIPVVPPQACFAVVRLVARGREVDGRIWFDGVRLFRQPRFSVEGLPPGHLFDRAGPAALTLVLGGLDAGAYSLEGVLTDPDGLVRWHWEEGVSLPQGLTRKVVDVPLPEAGYSRFLVTLSTGGRVLATLETFLGMVPSLPPLPQGTGGEGSEIGRLGVLVRPDAELASQQARLLEHLCPGAAAIEVWTSGTRLGSGAWGENPADLLLRQARHGVSCIGILGDPPPGATQDTIRSTLLRYWGEVDAWAFRAESAEGWEAQQKRWEEIRSWALALPRGERWGVVSSGTGIEGLQVGSPFAFAILPEGARVPQGLARWSVLGLEPPADGPRIRERLRAFSLKGLRELWAGHAVFLRLDAAQGGLLLPDGSVAGEFLAWRTLAHLLRDARLLGEVPLSPEVEAYALSRGGQTLLMAWTREPGREVRVLMPAQVPVTAVDLMGASRSLEPVLGQVTLTIGDLPTGFLSVSGGWLSTRRTMRLDGPVLAARTATRRLFRFENGFDTPLIGTLRLTAPPGWRVVPSSLPVALGAGAGFAVPVDLIPAPYEVTGGREEGKEGGKEKRLLAELSFGTGSQAALAVPVLFRFAQEAMAVSLSTHYQSREDEILVSQQVVNRGKEPLFCDSFLSTCGRPERRKPLGRLEPGEIRRVEYVIPWREMLEGETVVGVEELDGPRRFAVESLRGE